VPYLTPDIGGGDYLCRRLRFRAELAGFISGALEKLTKQYAWELDGDMTVDQVTELATEALNYYLDSGDTCLIGTIVTYITDTPPNGVLPLVGGTYLNEDYPLLAEVWAGTDLNNGDGTFNVPDTRGYALVHVKAVSGLPTYLMQGVGEINHVLTTAEMPSHGHSYGVPTTDTLAVEPGEAPASTGVFSSNDTNETGGDGAHNNVQPSFGVNFGVVAR